MCEEHNPDRDRDKDGRRREKDDKRLGTQEKAHNVLDLENEVVIKRKFGSNPPKNL